MTHPRSFDEMFPVPIEPYAWIQWKGTNVCMDLNCACGALVHVDAEFAYYVRCPHCRRIYAMDGHVRAVELTDEEVRAAKRDGYRTIDGEWDEDIGEVTP